jgi:hypothetical protein
LSLEKGEYRLAEGQDVIAEPLSYPDLLRIRDWMR